MKKLLKNIKLQHKIKKLLKEGYEYYTIRHNGVITDLVFYRPEGRIYNYAKEKFSY